MDIKTRLTRCCGKPIGGDNCREGMRCSDCFDKLEGLREIERLREALNEAETICLAQYVTLMCAGENAKASNVKKVADKLTTLLKKENE